MINRRMGANFQSFLLQDEVLLNELMQDTKNCTEYMVEQELEHMTEIVDYHYKDIIRKIELNQELKKLDLIRESIILKYKDGISVDLLASMLAIKASEKLVNLMYVSITRYFDNEGIIIKVNYDYDKYEFALDFTTTDDDKVCGKIVNLKLEDILENMIMYNCEFLDSVISTLTYKTLQAVQEDK